MSNDNTNTAETTTTISAIDYNGSFTTITTTTNTNANNDILPVHQAGDTIKRKEEVVLYEDDNPCWGSIYECSLEYLLSKIHKNNCSIVYENDNYIVFNKPPDLRMDGKYQVTVYKLLSYWYPPPSINILHTIQQQQKQKQQESKNDNTNTLLLNAVSKLHFYNDCPDKHNQLIRPCHQLDYATSGILLIAKNKIASKNAQYAFENRIVYKTYIAVLHGHVNINNNNNNNNWPTLSLTKESIEMKLQQIENQYRKSKKRKGIISSSSSSQDDSNSKKKKMTFQGYLPASALYQKYRNKIIQEQEQQQNKDNNYVDNNSNNNSNSNYEIKSRNNKKITKKNDKIMLTEVEWQQVWESVQDIDDKTIILSLSWKDLKKQHSTIVQRFEKVEIIYNDIIKQKLVVPTTITSNNTNNNSNDTTSDTITNAINNNIDKEQKVSINKNNNDNNSDAITNNDNNNSYFPPFFQLEESKNDTFYIAIPLADVKDQFAVLIGNNNSNSNKVQITNNNGSNDDNNNTVHDYKPCLTEVRILNHSYYYNNNNTTKEPVTLVEFHPHTGRRHQLRAHAASIGHPILGDVTYCDDINDNNNNNNENKRNNDNYEEQQQQNKQKRIDCPRLCLHAASLHIPGLLSSQQNQKGKQKHDNNINNENNDLNVHAKSPFRIVQDDTTSISDNDQNNNGSATRVVIDIL